MKWLKEVTNELTDSLTIVVPALILILGMVVVLSIMRIGRNLPPPTSFLGVMNTIFWWELIALWGIVPSALIVIAVWRRVRR